MKKLIIAGAIGILWSAATMVAQEPAATLASDNPAAPAAEAEHSTVEPVEADAPRTAPGRFSLKYAALQSAGKLEPMPPSPDVPDAPVKSRRFDWSGAVKQSLMFLGVQHGYAMTQPKTRHALKGPFFRDYFDSVRALHGWDDGGRFFTNYIAHPMEGAMYGFIQVHNDPKGRGVSIGNNRRYWSSRAKALAWAAVWSTQFEIGPLSQASIGNVGLKGKQTYVDIVVTPTVGTAWLVAEDFMDRYVSRPLEQRFNWRYLRIFARMLLNPVRTMANIVRFEKPWYRDRGLR
jgi:hypothetical protein